MGTLAELRERGFTTIEGLRGEAQALSRAYDEAFASTPEADVKRGSTTTRFAGIVAADPFYRIYLHPPLLELASGVFGRPFRLSSFCARTLRPHTPAPPLHQDVKPGSDGDPLLAFILMVDDFTEENGATRFVPGSRKLPEAPLGAEERQACGPAGSMVIFDGATWHEHGANRTGRPRRSIQGYFVRKDHQAAERWSDWLSPEQAVALPDEARPLLNL